MNYDVIGDIHGQHDRLVALLRTLGYQETMRAWRHPIAPRSSSVISSTAAAAGRDRQARARDDRHRAAKAILGNHEFNAIGLGDARSRAPRKATAPARSPRQPATARGLPRGGRGHAAPRRDRRLVQDPAPVARPGRHPRRARVLERCVHGPVAAASRVRRDAHRRARRRRERKGHWAFDAVETLCKGPEVDLPGGRSFTDQDGKRRTRRACAGGRSRTPARHHPSSSATTAWIRVPRRSVRSVRASTTARARRPARGVSVEGEPALRKTHFLWV